MKTERNCVNGKTGQCYGFPVINGELFENSSIRMKSINWAQLLSKQSSLCHVLANGLGQLWRDGEWQAVRLIFSAADIPKPCRIKSEEQWRTSKTSDISLFNTIVVEWVVQLPLSYLWKHIFLVEISIITSEVIPSYINPLWHPSLASTHFDLSLPRRYSLTASAYHGEGRNIGHLCALFKICKVFRCCFVFNTNIAACFFGAAR